MNQDTKINKAASQGAMNKLGPIILMAMDSSNRDNHRLLCLLLALGNSQASVAATLGLSREHVNRLASRFSNVIRDMAVFKEKVMQEQHTNLIGMLQEIGFQLAQQVIARATPFTVTDFAQLVKAAESLDRMIMRDGTSGGPGDRAPSASISKADLKSARKEFGLLKATLGGAASG